MILLWRRKAPELRSKQALSRECTVGPLQLEGDCHEEGSVSFYDWCRCSTFVFFFSEYSWKNKFSFENLYSFSEIWKTCHRYFPWVVRKVSLGCSRKFFWKIRANMEFLQNYIENRGEYGIFTEFILKIAKKKLSFGYSRNFFWKIEAYLEFPQNSIWKSQKKISLGYSRNFFCKIRANLEILQNSIWKS